MIVVNLNLKLTPQQKTENVWIFSTVYGPELKFHFHYFLFVLQDDVSESGLVSEISQLLRMIFQSMVQCSPTSESAEILIASVSKIQVDYNQKLKKLKKKLGKHSVIRKISFWNNNEQ
jgi:hypothetical protein